MASPERTCPACGARVAPDASACPACRTALSPRRPVGAPRATTPDPPEATARPAARAPAGPPATDLSRRLARLAQWSEAAEPLGVEIPRLPAWAEEAAARSHHPEPWSEVVRGVERLAQRRIAEAFERWEERTSARIVRLEAYSVDSRLERSQVEDAVHAARVGDLAQALASFHQVDRVVALKEHHLDQARSELERLLAFLRDLEELGLVPPGESAEVAGGLERELRTGRLAPLKQRLRLLHARAAAQLSESFPEYVAQMGDQLGADRRKGAGVEADARELAVAARAIVLGRPEEGARRLRALKDARGLAVPRSSGGPDAGPA